MANIKIHVLNFHGLTSHLELLLENPITQPSTYYRINRWAEPDIAWRKEEKVWLKHASSKYSFEIEADPNEISHTWHNYYYETENDASIFGENCAVVAQRFLTHFADIPEPSRYNLSWNHLAFGIMWPSFTPCPVMLPGLVMDNVKRHTKNVLSQSTSIMDLSESGENKYKVEAIQHLKQIYKSSVPQSKKALIKFNALNEFYCCLRNIDEKASNLKMNEHANIAKTANQLVSDLHSCALEYLKNTENTAFETFKSKCINHIKIATPELEKSKGWKHLLMNLILAILGAGAPYIAIADINRKLNGKFTFFKHVNRISDEICKLGKIENAMRSRPLSSIGS